MPTTILDKLITVSVSTQSYLVCTSPLNVLCQLNSEQNTEIQFTLHLRGLQSKSKYLKTQESVKYFYKNLLARMLQHVFCQRRYKRKLIKYVGLDGEFGAEQCTKGPHTASTFLAPRL